jgi:hypothetical protein
MNQGNHRDLNRREKLEQRIECLVDIQDTLRAALEKPCSKGRRSAMESMLHRHKLKEELARQELAALE